LSWRGNRDDWAHHCTECRFSITASEKSGQACWWDYAYNRHAQASNLPLGAFEFGVSVVQPVLSKAWGHREHRNERGHEVAVAPQ
jgi:hypothetical protein